jgi:branched-chain amino acid transport system ATP-binding protein
MNDQSDTMLEVSGLRSGYGRIPILSGVTLSVAPGEFVGILGHNGMGKSTLLRTLMGYLPATEGTMRFLGQDLAHAPPYARARLGIGYVPQGREIFATLSVYENLRMGCTRATDEQARIKRVLAQFPRLERLLDRSGSALSGGEQQLLALARCLCSEPRLILLDEPTEGIQPSIIDEMIETLQTLRKQSQLTMLLVEQNLNFIASLSHRVLVIQKGVITRAVPPEVAGNREMLEEFVGLEA